MIPKRFEEANIQLVKAADATIGTDCQNIPVCTDNIVCTSQWHMSWKERLHCLIHGFVWVRIYSGGSQPPIAIDAVPTVFETHEKT